MEDALIIELFWQRKEEAIGQTADKYGSRCLSVARNILRDDGEAEECVNDAYLKAWLSIPPARPERLSAFLVTVVRRLALDKWRRRNAEKREGDRQALLLSELADCLPDRGSDGNIDLWVERTELTEALDRFLREQKQELRRVFVLRYVYAFSIGEIAEREDVSENAVTVRLSRMRKALRKRLEKEGIAL